MRPFTSTPTVPVLRLSGPIGMATPLRQGLSLETVAAPFERAFKMSKLPAVAVVVNSPGGSPVQSSLILRRLRQLADEHKKKIYVFCEDVAASGGYYIALAGDEIYADGSSIVGSIGVIAAGFGFVEAIDKLGIERRVYTAGEHKSVLDPFRPEKPDDVARLKQLQADVHEIFKSVVRERRGDRLVGQEAELFSGAFWSAERAKELGLIDGVVDMRTRMRELFGDKVVLRAVRMRPGGLLSWIRRTETVTSGGPYGFQPAQGFADDIVSAIEARMIWSRYGL